jgi:hypothetical protein
MAQIFVSAGVYDQEIDETFLPPAGAGAVGAALIGLTKKGPAFIPTTVNNFNEFRDKFGGLDSRFYMPYAAKSYLRHSSTLTVTRVLGRGTVDTGHVCALAFPRSLGVSSSASLTSTNTTLAILKFRGTVEEVLLSGSPTDFTLVLDTAGLTSGNLSLDESSNNYIKKVLGTDPTSAKGGDSLTGLYVEAVFDWNQAAVLGSVSANTLGAGMTSCTAAFNNITGGFAEAATPEIVSQNFGGDVYSLFKIHTRSHGDDQNKEVKVSISHVDTATTGFPSFTVTVRDFNDVDRSPIVLETFANVNLDRSSKQFIGRVIGDRRAAYDFTQEPPEILYDGEYDNASNYIRVSVFDGAPSVARPSGFRGIPSINTTANIPALPTQVDNKNSRATVDSSVFMGVNFETGGIRNRLKPTVTSASGTSSANDGMLFYSVTGDYGGSTSASITGMANIDMAGSNSGNFSTTNPLRFTVPLYGGFDGLDARSDKLTDSNDGTLSADHEKAIKILSNPDEYTYNLIAMPDVWSSAAGGTPDILLDMVGTRGDAFYILDIANGTTSGNGLSMTVAQAQAEAEKFDSNYGATYYPWVRINDVDNDKLVWVPPSVEVISAYAFNDRVAQPWFAPAGFNRGGMENVMETRRRLTQGQRDDLITRNVNPIATFPGQGIVIWGQDTLQKSDSLLSKVSVRRMMLTVRKTIASFSRGFVFDQNTASQRSKLSKLINDYLQGVQQAQGLEEFRAILDETTTTPDLIDRNTMKGKIILKPTSAAEIILLDFAVTKNGAVFDE